MKTTPNPIQDRIARAIGALVMAVIVLIAVGFILGWVWAFIGLGGFTFWTLTRLHMEAGKDA